MGSRRHLTPEQQERQDGLDRSWAAAQQALADPEFRAFLEDAIKRSDETDAQPISKQDFLDQTEPRSPE